MSNDLHDALDQFGEIADRVDALVHALQLRLPDSLHIEALRQALPSVVTDMRAAYVRATGRNPWADAP